MSREILCSPIPGPRYNFRGERSDKDFSLQSQTGRGKLSMNTLKIQSSRNFSRRYDREMRRKKWSF
jgi:hypothetical protein